MKVDLHLHSKYSWDSNVEIIDYIREAESKGFGAIAITDHNSTDSHRELESLKATTDIILIPGQEVSTKDGHLLVYGRMGTLPSDLPMGKTVRLAKDEGGVCVAAHPFDPLRGGKGRRVFHTGVDGAEVLNASMLIGVFNRVGRYYTSKTNLFMVGNSDSHRISEFGTAYTVIKDADDVEGVLSALKEGEPGGKRLGVARKARRFIGRKLGK